MRRGWPMSSTATHTRSSSVSKAASEWVEPAAAIFFNRISGGVR